MGATWVHIASCGKGMVSRPQFKTKPLFTIWFRLPSSQLETRPLFGVCLYSKKYSNSNKMSYESYMLLSIVRELPLHVILLKY